MKKSLTRKLTIAVIALVFAVVSLSTSTYAWFTMSNEADIEAFEAEVKAGDGIEIAVTTGTDYSKAQWYTGLVPSADIQAVVNPKNAEGKYDFKFDAVTPVIRTYNGFTFEDIDKKPMTSGWISFFVHIKAANAGKIYLEDIELNSVSKPWIVDAPFTVASTNGPELQVNAEIEYKVENSARIAIYTAAKEYIYEKNAEDYAPAEGENVAKAGNTVGFSSNTSGALEYYNEKNTKTYTSPEAYGTVLLNSLDGAGCVELGTITDTSTPLSLQVVVWVEGWDAECLNAIFAQTLKTAVSFKYEK